MAERDPILYCASCGSKVEEREAFGQRRPVCPSCGRVHFIDPKVGAALLLARAGKVLLVRRSVDPEKGMWTLPAGFVEGDEDPVDTAVRECLEETGLNASVTGLVDVIYGNEHPSGASIVIVYSGEIVGGTLAPDDDADKVEFFDPDTLPPLAFKATARAIERWNSNPRSR